MRDACRQLGVVLWALAIGAGLVSCASANQAAETRAEAEERTKLAVPRIVGRHANGSNSVLTGVCIWSDDQAAIVLTNAHLLRDPSPITHIEVQFPAGNDYPAELLFWEYRGLTDIAVLQIATSGQRLPSIPLASEDARVGDPVFLLGYPQGQTEQDIRHGVLRPNSSPEPLAVYSFPTEQGHSGSPILNHQLQMVALHWGGTTYGHGIPVSHVVACCKRRGGEFPILQRIFGGGPSGRPPAVGSRQMPVGQPSGQCGPSSCSPAYQLPQTQLPQTWQTVTGPTAPVVDLPAAPVPVRQPEPVRPVPSQPPPIQQVPAQQAPVQQAPPQIILPERPATREEPQTNLAPPPSTPPSKAETQGAPPIAAEATDPPDAAGSGFPWWLMPYVLTAAGTAAGVGVPAWLVWGVRGAAAVGHVRAEIRRHHAGTHPPHPGTHAKRESAAAPTPKHVCPRPGVVAIENPPPPQQVLTKTQYVSYEVNSHAEAYTWAKRKLVEKHPGASDQMRVLDSLIRQYLAAQNPKELD